MDTMVERCAGLDVHQRSVTACVRVPGEGGERRSEIRTFKTTTAGLLTLHQAMGIILGADVGTSFTVQLLAFRVYDYAPLMVGLGFSVLFFAKRRLFKDLGQALLGFGLIFLGLKLMIDGMEPLKASPVAA